MYSYYFFYRQRVLARREVILAAGSIGSAQLLMISGIGPRDHLQEMGINVVTDLPVGYNLQDHVTFSGNAFIVNETKITVNDVSNSVFRYILLIINNFDSVGYFVSRNDTTLHNTSSVQSRLQKFLI